MLKVWGRNNSVNVQKVMWTLGELGLAHERIDIGGPFGGNREPAYLAKNPNGLIPTLEDGDLVLWESNTIVRYLAAKHGALEPSDLAARALAQQWMDWTLTVYTPAITPAFHGLVRTPPEQRNHAAIQDSQAKTIAAVRMLDAQLARTPYLAGDDFSIGDIPAGAMTHRYWHIVPERPELPNVARWYAALAERPAYRTHIADLPIT